MNYLGCLLLSLACGMPLFAERYAVLAGVGIYKAEAIKSLQGPRYDIEVLNRLLIKKFGYRSENMTVLLNEDATKERILQALDRTVSEMKAGDRLLFYFSGHGTSGFDEHNQALQAYIGPDSGALIPHDLDLRGIEAVGNSLVIGQRDLRPILSRVPRSAQALVVLDSCYSENAAKAVGMMASAPSRGVSLSSLLQAADDGGSAARFRGNASRAPSGASPDRAATPYPYSNVVSFAAASKNETAADISAQLVARGVRTVDGQPHGAFTNSLLAGLDGRADTNHDGAIGYDELFRFIRSDMQGRFDQTPQMLAPEGMTLNNAPLDQEAAIAPARPQPTPSANPPSSPAPGDSGMPHAVRVRLQNVSPELREKFAGTPGIQIADAGYQLLVQQSSDSFELYHSSGTLIRRYGLTETVPLMERISAETEVSQLNDWRYPKQVFNVRVDAEPAKAAGYDKYRQSFRIGEPIVLRASTDRPAYLLLLNIDKNGSVSVLFPGIAAAERGPQQARAAIEIGDVRAQAPVGSEHVKLFAFAERPEGWENWACSVTNTGTRKSVQCPEFGAGDERMRQLLQMLRSAPNAAEASLRLISHE